MTEHEPLDFKPINEGLGFHPFSNGLPYAPVTKNTQKNPVSAPTSTGTGAVAAGPPRFARPAIPQKPILSKSPMAAAPLIVPTQTPIAPEIPQALALASEPHFGFLYLLKRCFAYSLDCFFNLILIAGAAALSVWNMGIAESFGVITGDLVAVTCLLFLILNWMLTTAQEVIFKNSMGKKLFGLTLADAGSGPIFVRAIAFPVGIVFFGLGLIWAVFDSKRRCWHDIASHVQPLEIAKHP